MNEPEKAEELIKREEAEGGGQRLCLSAESMRDHWGLTSRRENALCRGIFDQHIARLPFMHEKQGRDK